ncbi:MAG: N-acetylmuramoyl-L-alanine amidase [Clostridia bacterium]|nr:N-acetylmuramoyl-L-alanine amidase [Clostridia bacterium]
MLAGTLCLAWMGLTEKRTLPASASPGITLGDIPDDACVIIIDAGHGGFDGGAVGTETGAIEAELNLSIAKTLADELTKSGFYVIMTRSGDGALGDTKSEDMKARGEIIGLERADAVVSIHINKFRDRTVSGPMVFYMKGSEAGKSLADSIMFSLCEKLGRAPRYTNPEDLFVLRVPKAPSVLIECGFLSNAADEALLVTPEHRENIAKAAAEGIKNYFAQMKSGDPR